MMKRWYVPLVLSALAAAPLVAQNKLVVATPGFDHPVAQVVQKLLPEAAKKIGFDVEFKVMPPERAQNAFDEGSVDAYIFSDASFSKTHPASIRIGTMVGSDDIVVFTKKDTIKVDGWASIKPYSIGYMIGMPVVENNIKGFTLEPSQNPPQAFQKLDIGRSDVVVMPLGVGLMMIKNLKLSGITALKPPLEKVPLYMFLTGKNTALAAKLNAVMADLEKSGRIKAVTDEVYASFAK